MRKSNNITVEVSRFGHETESYTVAKDSTVEELFEVADLSLSGRESLFVEGEEAEMDSVLEDGDILTISTPKEGG